MIDLEPFTPQGLRLDLPAGAGQLSPKSWPQSMIATYLLIGRFWYDGIRNDRRHNESIWSHD